MEKFAADAAIKPDAARDILHIAAHFFAQVRHLVDEHDLGGEEGVGGVLDQFTAAARCEQDRRAVQEQRAIDFLHHAARPVFLGTDYDAIGPLEIADSCAFAQEFGV